MSAVQFFQYVQFGLGVVTSAVYLVIAVQIVRALQKYITK